MPTPPLEEARGVLKGIQADKVRRVRAHTSLYVSRKVARMLQRIAMETGRDKVHDVMLEAIDDVLRKYGKPSVCEIDETHHWGGSEAQTQGGICVGEGRNNAP